MEKVGRSSTSSRIFENATMPKAAELIKSYHKGLTVQIELLWRPNKWYMNVFFYSGPIAQSKRTVKIKGDSPSIFIYVHLDIPVPSIWMQKADDLDTSK